MPLEMSYEDLVRDLRGCVVMYKNKPVYVTSIGKDGEVVFRDLGTQKEERAPFTLKDFTAPVRRAGFVNVFNSVVYVSRVPYRRYYLGMHMQNTVVKSLVGVGYEHGASNTKARVACLCVPELGDAIMDKYPTFNEACKQVKKYAGACAFDKQFAVSTEKRIFYKGDMVGECDLNAKSVHDIRWAKGKEHLILLLEGNYEKTVRDFRPAS